VPQSTNYKHSWRKRPQCKSCEEYLAILAHELRAPLAPISTGLELLRTTADDPDIVHEVHEIVQRQLDKLAALIDDAFGAARNTIRGGFSMKSQQIDLKSVAESAVEKIGAAVKEAGYQLTIDLPDEPVFVDGDPHQLARELSNLLDNAMRFAPRGSTIRIAARHEGDLVVLTVSAGEGQGAAFTIRLPAASAQQESAQSLRILIADDNQPAADMLAMILESYGHELFIAYNGQQAIQLAETHRPDVIFLDLSMPIIDGYEVARTIRRKPSGQEPLLIALTGWVQERDKQKAKDAGFDHHVVKPTKASDLRGLLSQAKRRTADSRVISVRL
jgi:CheY-like chemotaxis protein